MRDTRGRRGEVSRPHQSRGLQVMQLCVELLQLGPHVGQPLLQARRQRRPVPEARRCRYGRAGLARDERLALASSALLLTTAGPKGPPYD
jgi:hypothetical protein